MTPLVVVLGIIGLLAAVAVLAEGAWSAVRRRRYLDLVVLIVVAAAAVWALVAFGDRLFQ